MAKFNLTLTNTNKDANFRMTINGVSNFGIDYDDVASDVIESNSITRNSDSNVSFCLGENSAPPVIG